MRTSKLRHPTLLLICTLLLACASMDRNHRLDQLEQAQRDYETAIRWGNLDAAFVMHRNADSSVPTVAARLGNYRVTDYQVLSRSVAKDAASAEQVVQISYYNTDYMQEKTLTLHQHWRHNAGTHAWVITSPPPDFK